MNKIKILLKNYENNSSYLLLIGLLSALFFSATFVINRAISLEGGHWYWTASLRFFYTIIFLSIGLIFFKGFNYFKIVIKDYISKFWFYTICGTFGFGFFYSMLCYASDFAPGWIVATTWQLTIIASLIVLVFFKKRVSKMTWVFTIIVFIGVTIVNLAHFSFTNLNFLLLGFIPVLIAAFSYPLGNQLMWEEKIRRKQNGYSNDILNNSFVKVFLITLGSFPFWVILYFITLPPMPSNGQLISVAMVSLLSGVIATSLFLYARSIANSSSKLVVVDATQSGEVFFALVAEIIFLSAPMPTTLSFIGIFLTIFGLILLVKFGK
ncbi:DMT family transporter [Arcobacter sp. CECT 8986]|uniref:DMT family transporter n=1 Tax=Arcobacter sp. CECT 8986 TaxID=2044507 RepID=UPI002159CFCE|nr:multidrug resistance efflux transporter family protein [Arcobacter sp. CECT 8986]